MHGQVSRAAMAIAPSGLLSSVTRAVGWEIVAAVLIVLGGITLYRLATQKERRQ